MYRGTKKEKWEEGVVCSKKKALERHQERMVSLNAEIMINSILFENIYQIEQTGFELWTLFNKNGKIAFISSKCINNMVLNEKNNKLVLIWSADKEEWIYPSLEKE